MRATQRRRAGVWSTLLLGLLVDMLERLRQRGHVLRALERGVTGHAELRLRFLQGERFLTLPLEALLSQLLVSSGAQLQLLLSPHATLAQLDGGCFVGSQRPDPHGVTARRDHLATIGREGDAGDTLGWLQGVLVSEQRLEVRAVRLRGQEGAQRGETSARVQNWARRGSAPAPIADLGMEVPNFEQRLTGACEQVQVER